MNFCFAGQQDEVTENGQESAKAIVVADWFNNISYQYLLDEKRWVKLNKFPESVGRINNIFEIKNTCYVVGSKGISTLNNEFYKFPSNKEYYWCITPCLVENNILVVSKENYYDDDVANSLFNPINKQWSDANIKINRKQFTLVYYLNKVWIIGGYEDDGNWKTLKTVEVYDPVAKSHVYAPIKMNEERSSHKVIVYKNKLFVFGGIGKDGPLNSVEMFSAENQKFVMVAPMKIARSNFACCRVANLVYVIGGWTHGGRTKSVQVYNLDSNTWTDGVEFPVAARDLHACAVSDKLY